MEKKLVAFKKEQWNNKAEAIRRNKNLSSKSEAVRYSVDKTYSDLELEPITAPAELEERK